MSDKLKTGESKMKNFLIAATALATLASAPAFAQVQSGTIKIKGSVGASCTVIPTTSVPVDLGDISTGVGELNAALVNSIGGNYGSRITCNGVGTKVGLSANKITGDVPVPLNAPTIFTNTVNYTAALEIVGTGYVQTPSAPGVIISDSSTATTPDQTVGLIWTNVRLNVSDAALPTGATTLVASEDYNGSIDITLTPDV
jgi:hypothetical protein